MARETSDAVIVLRYYDYNYYVIINSHHRWTRTRAKVYTQLPRASYICIPFRDSYYYAL